jgi:hypothetical protein
VQVTLRCSAVLLTFCLLGLPVAGASAAQRFEPMRHVFLGGREVLTWDGGDLLVAGPYDIADRSLVVVRESTGARFRVQLDPECYLLEGDDQVADARVLLNCNTGPGQRLLDLRTGISQELKPPDDLGLANIPWQSIGRRWMRGEIHTPQLCHWGGCSIYRNLQTGELRPLYETVPVNLDSRQLTVKGCHTSVGISVHKLTLNRCGRRPRIIYRGRVGRPGYDLLNGEPVKLRDGVVTWATRNGVVGAYRVATGRRALWRVPIDRDSEYEVEGQDISVTRTRHHIYVGVASNWSIDSLPTPINRRAYVASLRGIGL